MIPGETGDFARFFLPVVNGCMIPAVAESKRNSVSVGSLQQNIGIIIVEITEELAEAKEVDDLKELAEQEHLRQIPMSICVYEITGPLFFGAADQLKEIGVKSQTRVLILRMRGVPALDITALNALKDLRVRLKRQGITLVLSHVNEQPMKVMEKGGFLEKVGEENICENIDAAIERAEYLISQPKEKKGKRDE